MTLEKFIAKACKAARNGDQMRMFMLAFWQTRPKGWNAK